MTHTIGNDSEATPLLVKIKHEDVYLRFKPAQKRVILAIVSATGLLPLFVSGSFVPSIPQIAKDLNSNAIMVSWAVSVSILATSLGPLLGATYSGFYGRKPVYLVGTPLLFIGSMGVASAQTIPQLMVWRIVQALGASPGLAVGSGVIGDIYKLEERGQAMGIFFAAVLLGPALAPLAGGITAHYFSWRIMQMWLGLCGLLIFFVALFIFPETYHPGERGVDKADPTSLPTWRPVLINPFTPLWTMRSPNLLAVGAKYNITNEALIGACFLPCGIGNMIGAPLSGIISDKVVIYYRKSRGGAWYPEDRLRGALIGSLIFVPLSILGSGLLTAYVAGRVGLVLNLICLFLNGLGVDFVLSPSAAYIVDLMHSRSAEVSAANNGIRSVIIALAVAGVLPMINTYGVVVTNTVAAVLAWIGFILLWGTIRYGDRLRAVVDVGFSTADNN
ncbi:Transporter [Psilocybe cyanescens]|uniref:Transporter n=1 Tax=Psilocybe cyanescens TaxID=93625 RepID=A0A409WXL0_PSICY|nr:Transporter [Psilocybe cyanescens]